MCAAAQLMRTKLEPEEAKLTELLAPLRAFNDEVRVASDGFCKRAAGAGLFDLAQRFHDEAQLFFRDVAVIRLPDCAAFFRSVRDDISALNLLRLRQVRNLCMCRVWSVY